MHSLPEYGRFLISLFAILSPFAAIPLFLTLTDGFDAGQKSRTAAELAPAEKNTVSHRAIALRALVAQLRAARP